MAGMNNPPGTPRDDGEMAGNFLNPFQSESVSTVSYDTQKKTLKVFDTDSRRHETHSRPPR